MQILSYATRQPTNLSNPTGIANWLHLSASSTTMVVLKGSVWRSDDQAVSSLTIILDGLLEVEATTIEQLPKLFF